ncbi:hypothetical protein M1D72_01160 [Vibrio sp. AK197]
MHWLLIPLALVATFPAYASLALSQANIDVVADCIELAHPNVTLSAGDCSPSDQNHKNDKASKAKHRSKGNAGHSASHKKAKHRQ